MVGNQTFGASEICDRVEAQKVPNRAVYCSTGGPGPIRVMNVYVHVQLQAGCMYKIQSHWLRLRPS